MVEVGNVTANLILDASEFTESLTTARTQLESFMKSFKKYNDISSSLNKASKDLTALKGKLSTVEESVKGLKNSLKSIGGSVNVGKIARNLDKVNSKVTSLNNNLKQTYAPSLFKGVTSGMSLLDQAVTGVNSKLNVTLNNIQRMRNISNASFGNNIARGLNLLDQTEQKLRRLSNISFGDNITRGMVLLDQAVTGVNNKLNQNIRLTQLATQQINRGKTRKSNIKEIEDMRSSLNNLKLDFKENVMGVQELVNAFNSIDRANPKIRDVDYTIDNLESSLLNTERAVVKLSLALSNMNGGSAKIKDMTRELNTLKQYLDKVKNEFKNMSTTINPYSPKNAGFGKQVGQGMVLLDNVVSAENSKLNTTLRQMGHQMTNTVAGVHRATESFDKMSGSVGRANTSIRGYNNILRKSVGSMVAFGTVVGNLAYDMLYRLGYGIFRATKETITAKSEMEGYYNQMNWSIGSIDRFNTALDHTVERYQKLNKYGLGETMASLGVEFELNAQELSKGMETVAMIQSEYVRAGRNESEATLAVKDILQGEFLRLSRETGVGEKEIKEAGWSGDLKDINSLLTALDKIGKERHWDLFAKKANSLNDVLVITKNRMAEFATDIASFITPAIVSSFNMIVDGLSWLRDGFDGLGSTGQWIVGLTGMIPVLGGLSTVILRSRTGIGLLASANQGWLRTIQNVITGTNTLGMRVGGVNGILTAMMDKLTGADVASRNLFSSITRLDAGLAKNKSTLNQLATGWAYNAGVLKQNEVASTKTSTAFRKLATSTRALKLYGLIGMLIMLGAVIGDVTAKAEANREAWNGLTDMYDNGESIIEDANTTYTNLGNSVNALREKQASLTVGSREYIETTNRLNRALKDQQLAYDNLNSAKKAYEQSRKIKEAYDASIDSSMLQHQERLSAIYRQNGYDAEEANRKASELNYNVSEWNRVATSSAQAYNSALKSGDAHIASHVQSMKDEKRSQAEINTYIRDYGIEVQKNAELQKKWSQGDLWAGLGIHLSNLKKTWIELTHDKVFAEFWNGLNNMIKTVTPSVMWLAGVLRDVLWVVMDKLGYLLKFQSGQWLMFGGILTGVALSFGKVRNAISGVIGKLRGTDKVKDAVDSLDDATDVDGRRRKDRKSKKSKKSRVLPSSVDVDLPYLYKEDKGKTGKKKKSGKGGLISRITGGVDWATEGAVFKKNALKIARGMGYVALGIGMIIPSLIALAGVGATYKALEPQVKKGIEAVDKVKWILLAIGVPVIALMAVMSYVEGIVAPATTGMISSAVIITGVMATVSLVLGEVMISVALIAGIGKINEGGLVDKGVSAINSTKDIIFTIAVSIVGLGAVMTAITSGTAGVGLVAIGAGLLIGSMVIIGAVMAVTVVIDRLKSAVESIANIGASVNLEDVNRGVEGIKAVATSVKLIGETILDFNSTVIGISLQFTGLDGILKSATEKITIVIDTINDTIGQLKSTLGAIADLGGSDVDDGNLNQGVEYINLISNTLHSLDGAIDNLNSAINAITDAKVKSDDGKLDTVFGDVEDAIGSLNTFNNNLNGITLSAPNTTVEPFINNMNGILAGVDKSVGALNNTIGNLKNAKKNVKTSVPVTNEDIAVAQGITPNKESIGDISSLIDEVKTTIDDLNNFNNELNNLELSTPNETVAPFMDNMATIITNVNSAVEQVKVAVQGINSAEAEAGGLLGGLSVKMGGSIYGSGLAGQGNAEQPLGQSLKTLYNYVKDIVWFNNMLNTLTVGGTEGEGENISQVASLTQTLTEAVQSFTTEATKSAQVLETAGKTMGMKFINGIKTGMGDVANAVRGKFNFGEGFNNFIGEKGKYIGQKLTLGFNSGLKLKESAEMEINGTLSYLNSKKQSFYNIGASLGEQLKSGFRSKNGLDQHSPGALYNSVVLELSSTEQYMGGRVASFYNYGSVLGNSLRTGFTTSNQLGNPMNGVVPQMPDTSSLYSQVQTSADQIMALNTNTTTATNTAWTTLGNNMNSTFTRMTNDATSSYTNINRNTKSQLVQMRGVTENNIQGIRNSWNLMQNALINSAEVIRSQVSSKISQLEANMGSFWRKVRNPALLLGAGSPSIGRRPVSRSNGSRRTVARTLTHGLGSSRGMPAGSPKPSSTRGLNIADESNSGRKKIRLNLFDCLMNGGGDCYAGEPSDWNFNWSRAIIDSFRGWRTNFGSTYDPYLNVGKFENSSFPVKGNAEIFKKYVLEHIGKTDYEFYFGGKYGSPLNIWNAGHFNCYDGALLVQALASAFGFSSHMVHGKWNGINHVWTDVHGVGQIDATAIQNGYGLFAPSKVSAGAPVRRGSRGTSSDVGLGGTSIRNLNINVTVEGNGDDDAGTGVRIADAVHKELVKIMKPNPSTGI